MRSPPVDYGNAGCADFEDAKGLQDAAERTGEFMCGVWGDASLACRALFPPQISIFRPLVVFCSILQLGNS